MSAPNSQAVNKLSATVFKNQIQSITLHLWCRYTHHLTVQMPKFNDQIQCTHHFIVQMPKFKGQIQCIYHFIVQMPKCCHFMTVTDTSQSVKASVAGCSQSQGVTGFSVLQKSQFANLQRPQLIYSSFTDFRSLENGISFSPNLQKPSWTPGTKSVRPWQCR